MKIFYSILLFFTYIVLIPFRLLKKKKGDLHLKERFGHTIKKSSKKMTIWLHAISVGETRALITFYQKLKKEYPDAYFVISNQTLSGQKTAKKVMQEADQYFFFPLDFGFVVRRIIAKLHPNLFITCETDIWPILLHHLKKNGCTNIVLNGKISKKSYQRLKRFYLGRWFYKNIDLILAQSEEYKERFIKLKVTSSIETVGNLKCDPHNFAMQVIDRKSLGISTKDFVVVIGSTHDPEEKELLHPLKNLLKLIPNLKIFIVPRHPERFLEVEKLLIFLPFAKLSNVKKIPKEVQVILVDKLGSLNELYSIADVSIVAGSFTKKVGGHNVLEPIFAKSISLFGPHMEGQKELKNLVLESHAGLQISLKDLEATLLDLFKNKKKIYHFEQKGKNLVSQLQNLSEISFAHFKTFLSKKQ